ncbi:TVP38/TMEM64 family membrane protein [Melia azedarach]|uniref:TVP38/TMEM64 family membrane protein n=1 Tax=Melia azedarach TaxID=155640 RepID=A0ACC1YAP5_MELAZ|nr:TVP38/TMEM64 family membrane protein [Melia azedarach]
MAMGKWWKIGVVVAVIGIVRELSKQYGWDKDAGIKVLGEWSDRLGVWAMPVFIGVHTLTLALCLPYAVFFEAASSLLFGFFPAVLCVFLAKLLGASLSFWIGRLVFKSSSSAMEWAQRNKYFHVLSRGVEKDGWKFVLLARFSPMPSYVINYALAATKVGFILDFLLPTVIGCLPMILQNTSIGSLAGAAVASASGSQKSKVWSYLLPLLGIVSSILISLRIKKYTTDLSVADSPSSGNVHDLTTNVTDSSKYHGKKGREGLQKSQ